MATVKIAGLGPQDGTYHFDFKSGFTWRDYGDFKRVGGVRADGVEEAIEERDPGVIVALASIALRRAGVEHDPDALFDLPIDGGIELNFDDDEVEEDPTVGGSETPTASSDSDSGTASNPDTDTSPETLTLDGSGIPQPDSSSVPQILRT